ncbi:multidrug efflux MFS transporter [Streptococcus vestibularis]|uniref:multidrug efflux MFS transporter n=1 Tax=Streptococcus vestibularis TaxID=1343 RepID=UPI002284F8B1|nr:multidrug efflux MFS transporter [Streptococcus vestibularis]MCY7042731.1 multidrug efflux MFS transporter [Streptococcus vestibularis]MDU3178272.1 multidrug efflux MFS transporter [Streptococcus vestibularis]
MCQKELKSTDWQRNFKIAWIGTFFTGASFSIVMPFMALYIEELGIKGDMVEWYAGLSVAISALASALVSPIWGRLADRYGRKPMMIRASMVMTFTMGGLALVPNVFWLLFLRTLNGLFAGYVPNATALIASQVPQNRSGYALGTLSTGLTAGVLIGPLLGGTLSEAFGMRGTFLLVGLILFICCLLTIFGLREDFQPVEKGEMMTLSQVFARIPSKSMLIGLFVTSMIMQISAQSIAPMLALYIRYLGQRDNILFYSGLIVSAMGFSSLLSTPYLGKLGDRIGNHRLLLMGLFYSFLLYFLCGFAGSALQLGILRFAYGFGVGALMPSVNSLLTKMTPKEGISRIFSFNQSFSYIGQVLGPFVGSAVATGLGYRWVFFVTAMIVFGNFVWSLIIFRKSLGVKNIGES